MKADIPPAGGPPQGGGRPAGCYLFNAETQRNSIKYRFAAAARSASLIRIRDTKTTNKHICQNQFRAAPAAQMPTEQNPILNNPYEEPIWHYATNLQGELDYSRPVKGRRVFTPEVQTVPVRQGVQGDLLELSGCAA